MQPVSSQAEVGQVVPLIGGTPRQWAVITASQIMEAVAVAAPDASIKSARLRQMVASALLLSFMQVRTGAPVVVADLAEAVTVQIETIAATAPEVWRAGLTEIRQAVKDKIIQNLTSASAT